MRSQKAPSWGTSWARGMMRIWSSVRISGERPPCTQRMEESIICLDQLWTLTALNIESVAETYCCEIQVVEYLATCLPY